MSGAEERIDALCGELGMPYKPTKAQVATISHLLAGDDVFCLLPTGAGKSNIFAWFPLLMDKVTFPVSSSLLFSNYRI